MSQIEKFKTNFEIITNPLKTKRIVILGGGFGNERDASLYTAQSVQEELKINGFDLLFIDPAQDHFIDKIKDNDLVFNCLHGSFGESGHVAAILDYLRIPYTFSNIYASAMSMDKLFFKSIVKKLGYLVPNDQFDNENISNTIKKPRRSGGSIGIELKNPTNFDNINDLYECFISGKILTLGILEGSNEYIPLKIVQVLLPNDKKFYDQESKYEEGFSEYIPYSGGSEKRIYDQAIRIFKMLGITGCARIDLIETAEGELYYLEINSIPGLYKGSNLQYSAELLGLSYYELLVWILSNAKYQLL